MRAAGLSCRVVPTKVTWTVSRRLADLLQQLECRAGAVAADAALVGPPELRQEGIVRQTVLVACSSWMEISVPAMERRLCRLLRAPMKRRSVGESIAVQLEVGAPHDALGMMSLV